MKPGPKPNPEKKRVISIRVSNAMYLWLKQNGMTKTIVRLIEWAMNNPLDEYIKRIQRM